MAITIATIPPLSTPAHNSLHKCTKHTHSDSTISGSGTTNLSPLMTSTILYIVLISFTFSNYFQFILVIFGILEDFGEFWLCGLWVVLGWISFPLVDILGCLVYALWVLCYPWCSCDYLFYTFSYAACYSSYSSLLSLYTFSHIHHIHSHIHSLTLYPTTSLTLSATHLSVLYILFLFIVLFYLFHFILLYLPTLFSLSKVSFSF